MKKEEILKIMYGYSDDLRAHFGELLEQVILFGSYARDDYNEESDIDITLLLNLSEEEIKQNFDYVAELTSDYNSKYDIDISPLMKDIKHYRKWLRAYPFYNNIEKEGVKLYAA